MNNALSFVVVYPSVALGPIAILACIARWFARPASRRHTEWALVVSTLTVPLSGLAEAIAASLSRIRPLKYDEFVYCIDALLGEPSFALGRLVEHHFLLKALVSFTYGVLPMVIAAVFALYLRLRSEAEALDLLWTFVLNLLAAVPLYLLFPVCGPRFAFAAFPFMQPQHLVPHLMAIAAPPNGVPSVHTSSALLILWFLRQWPLGRVLGGLFLALTVLATLGSGQHYLFDLLCALPYAALVVFAVHAGRIRKAPTSVDRTTLSAVRAID